MLLFSFLSTSKYFLPPFFPCPPSLFFSSILSVYQTFPSNSRSLICNIVCFIDSKGAANPVRQQIPVSSKLQLRINSCKSVCWGQDYKSVEINYLININIEIFMARFCKIIPNSYLNRNVTNHLRNLCIQRWLFIIRQMYKCSNTLTEKN